MKEEVSKDIDLCTRTPKKVTNILLKSLLIRLLLRFVRRRRLRCQRLCVKKRKKNKYKNYFNVEGGK